MSQRASGYDRRPNEEYFTPIWVAAPIAHYLRCELLTDVWEPAAGNGSLVEALGREGFCVAPSLDDFFTYRRPPRDGLDAIVTNPPYGAGRRGESACAFIRHALSMRHIRVVAMLLRIDFDSAKTRVGLFRDHENFAGKIVLLNRVKWFPGESGPSDNHAWFIWNRMANGRPPWIAYAERASK